MKNEELTASFFYGVDNDSCFIGVPKDVNYFEKTIIPFSFINRKQHTTQASIRYEGTARPYSVKMSDSIILLMFLSLFLFISVFAKGRDYVRHMFQNLFTDTDKESIFIDNSTTSEYRIRFFLLLQTTISLAVLFFFLIKTPNGILSMPERETFMLISLFILVIFIFWGIKWLINKILGFIFFEKDKVNLWQNNYFSALSLYGVAFFPVLVLLINAPSMHIIEISRYILIVFFILGFIIITYKGIRFFLTKPHGILYFMLYLCALEIIPYIGLYMGLEYINEFV